MALIRGFDVSEYQSKGRCKLMKNDGCEFVIIRAGWGSYSDSELLTHYKEAKNCGLKVGFYWYSCASSVSEARKEAKICFDLITRYEMVVDFGIWYDLENEVKNVKNQKTSVYNIGRAFCEVFSENGIYCGLYASESWVDRFKLYKGVWPLWMAAYRNNNGNLDLNRRGKCAVLQYASNYKKLGISQDLNIAYYELSNYQNKSLRKFEVISEIGLNVRIHPGTEYKRKGGFYKGQVFQGYKYNNWVYIATGEFKGNWCCYKNDNGTYLKG